jgi:hypothetical protein
MCGFVFVCLFGLAVIACVFAGDFGRNAKSNMETVTLGKKSSYAGWC